MKKYGIPLIALVIGLIIGASAIYFTGLKAGITVQKQVPTEVEEKYRALTEQYKGTLGTTLSQCATPEGTVYTITGSTGFSGETFYYNTSGKELGRTEFSDTDLKPSPPPVDIDQDSCKKIRSTVPEIQ